MPTAVSLFQADVPVRILEIPSRKNRQRVKKLPPGIEVFWGDIRNAGDCRKAVAGCGTVIHLAAVIPPLADRKPELARQVNIEGTARLVEAAMRESPPCRFVFSSSVAVYGDRVRNPLIGRDDPLNPSDGDHYARQKIEAEELIRTSGLDWTIFRLSYIAVLETLKFDPLMFAMPLDTSLEICDPRDAGKALAAAAISPGSSGETFLLSGGQGCRTTYREYLSRILSLLGLGKKPLPDRLFSLGNFHCGFMAAEETENRFHFQHHTLSDFFSEVEKSCRVRRFFITLVRPLARRWLISLGTART
jgi:nucleoside-diphosphate-sugar epimerase